jgi:hypothetical protein
MVKRGKDIVAWNVVAQVRLSQGSRIAFVLNTNEAGNGKGVKIVDWCRDLGSRRKFVAVKARPRSPCVRFRDTNFGGARPILMLAVKRGVIWQVGRGRHLWRRRGNLVLADPQP